MALAVLATGMLRGVLDLLDGDGGPVGPAERPLEERGEVRRDLDAQVLVEVGDGLDEDGTAALVPPSPEIVYGPGSRLSVSGYRIFPLW